MLIYSRDKNEGACRSGEGRGEKSLLSDPWSELHLWGGEGGGGVLICRLPLSFDH